MKISVSIALASAGACLLAFPATFPLEWNERRSVESPYEVEISPAKLERLAGVPATGGFEVRADGRTLETTVLKGKAAGTVALRFRVPAGTKRLTCETGKGGLALRDAADVDNLFAGALADARRWRKSAATDGVEAAELPGGGIRLRNAGPTAFIRCPCEVPAALAGQPVKLELDCVSRTPMTWGGIIRFEQYDEQGRLLPECLSDPRWTSHMRPQGAVTDYRETGRLHPRARSVVLCVELRHVTREIDEYGLPSKDPEKTVPVLDVTRLAVRTAAELPFPKYRDDAFPAGVSGAADDRAIALGGERAFWYQTRSQASWAQRVELREESQTFFPSAAGTVEAWLKPSGFAAGTTRLFEASHHGTRAAKDGTGRATSNNRARGEIVSVGYRATERKVSVSLRDYAEKVFAAEGDWEMPVGRWTHLALAWEPDGEAVLFADGHRVLSVPLKGFTPYDLKTAEMPNSFGAVEFYLGSSWRSARVPPTKDPRYPFFEGAADLLRVSSVPRYRDDFTPAKAFAVDCDTRALFTFDRTFDGVSGGGIGWISGTWRDFVDRVDHALVVDGRAVPYYPAEVVPEMDPSKVLDVNNYSVLPTDADFAASRTYRSRTETMKNGETMTLRVPEGVRTEFVEIANDTGRTLSFPALVRRGEIDPRSFGDIADSLIVRADLSDRDRANRVFQFVLGASDYFMNHQPIFFPGSDMPEGVEYEALMMLNGYCGFECGPLNNLAANMLACAGRLPASQTAGYGHSFEQVFYDGKNHIYDLSAQQFFPAMDNETAAYLGEDDCQPGIHYRLGRSADHFIRLGSRGVDTRSPSFQRKVAMSLNPGERFRMWSVNDGACNDLQYNSCYCGNRRLAPPGWTRERLEPYEEDYEAKTHARIDKTRNSKGGLPATLTRIDRFFPHYSNGFLVFAGRPGAANPAFTNVTDASFCYRVESAYPIVAAAYSARRADGSAAALELCTDWKEFRPLELGADGVARLDYLVRARMAYWIRVKAPIADIAEFRASTEVMANTRIFPGRLVRGENELVFKAADGGAARVTLGWSEPAKPIVFEGAVLSGTIPGLERRLVALDPREGERKIVVRGVTDAARVRVTGGLKARIEKGVLTLSAASSHPTVAFATVEDGAASQELTVIVADGVKLLTKRVTLAKRGESVSFPVSGLDAGPWCLWNLTRWPSHADLRARPLVVSGGSFGTLPAAGACNDALQFYKAHYGQSGGRAQWKWDFVISPRSCYPYALLNRMPADGTDRLVFSLSEDVPDGVEIAAVLLMPFPEQEFRCRLLKALGGLNHAPARLDAYPETSPAADAESLKTPATSRLFEPAVDSVSGVRTWLLRQDLVRWNAQTLYFTAPTYSADGRFLLFLSSEDEFKVKSVPRKIMLIDFLKDEIVDLGLKYDRGPFLDSKTDSLYYLNRARQMVCRRDLLSDPLREIDVVAVPKEVGDLGKNGYLFSHITLTQDRGGMWCDCRVGNRYFQGMLDFATGAFEKWTETKFQCNHGQLNPVRDDIALCAWEGAKNKTVYELTDEERKTARVDASGITTDVKRPADWVYPRIQLFEKGKAAPTTIPSTFGNYATHEWWARDGRGFVFCGGGHVVYHDLATGRQRSVCSHGGTHATMSRDNRFVTFDVTFRGSSRGKPMGVGFCDAETDQVVWIRPFTGRYCEDNLLSKIHPDTHPHFSADDRWVVWTWLDHHRMRVAVTEVAPIASRLAGLPKAVPVEPRDWKTVEKEVGRFLKDHPVGTRLTPEERAKAFALAKEGPLWSRMTVAIFERLYADQ